LQYCSCSSRPAHLRPAPPWDTNRGPLFALRTRSPTVQQERRAVSSGRTLPIGVHALPRNPQRLYRLSGELTRTHTLKLTPTTALRPSSLPRIFCPAASSALKSVSTSRTARSRFAGKPKFRTSFSSGKLGSVSRSSTMGMTNARRRSCAAAENACHQRRGFSSSSSSTWMSHDRFHEKIGGETPVSGGSSNGGFWSRKVENALSFNGS
jgi:hypothetical protein